MAHTMACCGTKQLPFDKERVDALDRRISLMLEENGRPGQVRMSPDICHQITDGRTVRNITGVDGVCDPTLPPNSVIFEKGLIAGRVSPLVEEVRTWQRSR